MTYDTLPTKDIVTKTASALTEHGFETSIVTTKAEALEKIISLIPEGVSVMNGSSRTLEEIEFIAHLKSGTHGWKNLHEASLAEVDPHKKMRLMKEASMADYYLGSVHAISETGELVISSASGSQIPSIAFSSPNIIFVVSTQKIMPTLEDALKRMREHVVPLEDKRMKDVGYPGTTLSKTLIFWRENPMMGRKVKIILVNEKLGF